MRLELVSRNGGQRKNLPTCRADCLRCISTFCESKFPPREILTGQVWLTFKEDRDP
ncbi:hypothetical protein Psta_2693 [Pirellula staleyi DSM 6068]|uniref:Uncharacterized protein n=1 Tax=Pirellula staleyi (strain ATCC 27377 / DSM 6068 / ICPB 4128) TaxID=530564 RepID=D2R6R1_PIRSD|nr:hypothetical protein Psta_2693 [Pirellula staleyi DSM 6068]